MLLLSLLTFAVLLSLNILFLFHSLRHHYFSVSTPFKFYCSSSYSFFTIPNNIYTIYITNNHQVLRGVNLYGEKQWMLIADRYLPDRSINAISQRYSQLCVMLYKAHGISIDSKGKLVEPPKLESVDDIDEGQVIARNLKLVEPPDILNVHRWSIDEDITLLKAVPIMGHM